MVDERDQDRLSKNQSADRRIRVLVVDDSLDVVRTCAVLLQHAGFEVQTAYNGRDALKSAAEFQPHVALLDIGLPDFDGYEVARRLRADPSLPMITLIAITAYGTAEDRQRARIAGFDHHLTKPVEFRDLLCLIRPNPDCGERGAG
jgi:two-component system CheB/CheR fusion protein